MITKDPNYIYKYKIEGDVAPDEIKQLLKPMLHEFKGLILNQNTCKQLNIKPGESFVTINKSVEDGAFYINYKR